MAPLLIGIDVGMTCTGVCYYRKGVTDEPRMIQKWPGSSSSSSDKVITAVCYQYGRLTSWGFQIQLEDHNDPSIEVREWFKVALDEAEYNKLRAADPNSVPERYALVKEAYRDFLASLYGYVRQQLESTSLLYGSSWDDTEIDFLFTVPTTWTALGVTNLFKSLVEEAGFGTSSSKHTASVGLTEAEAAAVHTFATDKHAYVDGNIILVVDAGGGISDLALLKARNGELEQLDDVRGDEIGSVEIDIAFKEVVTDRLRKVSQVLGMTEQQVNFTAQRMVTSFKAIKEDFGSDNSFRQPRKRIDVPGISSDFVSADACIERGGMYFTNGEIRALFDVQMRRMFELIDFQMNRMSELAPYDQITHLVLSGGLGSSEYIFKEIRHRYVVSMQHPAARSIAILRSTFPQAAPVRGLIQDRLRRIDGGRAVLSSRKSRLSLGIVCDQLYDERYHIGAELRKDPVDGKTFAKDQIHWVIRKGDTVTDDMLHHAFHRTLTKSDARVVWTSRIVKSDREHPPRSMKDDGVIPLCRMQSDLTQVPLTQFEKKKKRWYQAKKPPTHFVARYEIRFQINPAVVDSELWFGNQKYSLPSAFQVEWDQGANLPAPKAHRQKASIFELPNDWDRRAVIRN